MCLIVALILSHSGNGPWVGLWNGTQIFTMDTNIFVSTSMQAGHVRYSTVVSSIQWLFLYRPSTSQLGPAHMTHQCAHIPQRTLSPPWELSVLMKPVKICPHVGHLTADAGQRFYSSSPISSDAHYFSHSSALSWMVCPKGLAQEAWL